MQIHKKRTRVRHTFCPHSQDMLRADSKDLWSGPAAPNEHRRPMTNSETACQACTMQPPLPMTHAFIAFIAGTAATLFAFIAFIAGAAAATLFAFMAFTN